MRLVTEQARQEGVTSFRGLADYLTQRGIRPVTGKVEWSNAMVAILLARIKKLNASNVPDHAPGLRAGSAGRTKAAQAFADSMREHLPAAVAIGPNSDRRIMARLNRRGLRTRAGELWIASGVKHLRTRLCLKPFSD
jgi:hypothetical protein